MPNDSGEHGGAAAAGGEQGAESATGSSWKQPAAAPAELELELEPEGLLLTDTCESPLTVFAGGAASRAHRADSADSEADSVSAELRALVAQGALTEEQARIILDATPI